MDLGLGCTDRLHTQGLHLRAVVQYTEHYFLVRRRDPERPAQPQHGLEALPLMRPEMRTPVGFMVQASDPPSRTLTAALAMAQEPRRLGQVAANSGALG